MFKRIISEIILIFLLIGLLTQTFNIHSVDSQENIDSKAEGNCYSTLSFLSLSCSDFGETIGFTRGGIYYNGRRAAIYVAYQNSSFSPYWHMQIRAFDLKSNAWSTPHDVVLQPPSEIGSSMWNDGHYAPSVSVLSDGVYKGHLIYFYGYSSAMFYRISTYSADATSDITTLISNWQPPKMFYSSADQPTCAYPEPLRWDDRLILFFRGAANDYDVTVYNNSQSLVLWCDTNDTTHTEWTCCGSQPYLNDSDMNYVTHTTNSGAASIGYFLFQNLTGLVATDYLNSVNISLYCTQFDAISATVYLNYNGTDQNIGTITHTGWTVFDVSSYLNTCQKVNSAKIRLHRGYNSNAFRINISRTKIDVTYEGFCKPYRLTVNGSYPNFNKVGDKVLLDSVLTDMDVSFCFSPDKGQTWRKADGTTLTTPVNLTECKVATSPYRTRTKGAILDENNKPLILVWHCKGTYSTELNGSSLQLAYYDTQLGSSGIWDIANVTDKFANQLYGGLEYAFFLDSYCRRPSFWCSSNLRVEKYVRMPNETLKFDCLWSKIEQTVIVSAPIRDSKEAYEVVLREQRVDILGNITIGSTATMFVRNETWASKFTCRMDASIVGFCIFANCTSSNAKWRAAIYNSTFQKVGNDTGWDKLVTGTTGYGWMLQASFQDPVQIVNGSDYWIVIQFDHHEEVEIYWSESHTNTTFRYDLNWTDNFPETINPTEFYNRTITLTAISSFMVIRGLDTDGIVGTSITVPDDFPTIQEAINNANIGDTIFVRNGTYHEHVVVNKTISLTGENKENTVIDGNWADTVVKVTADNVTISGFTIQNGEIGLDLNSNNNAVTSNIISSNGVQETDLMTNMEIYPEPPSVPIWRFLYDLMNSNYTELLDLTTDTPILEVKVIGHSDVAELLVGLFYDENMDGIPQLNEYAGFASRDQITGIMLPNPAKGRYIIKVQGWNVLGNPGHFDRKITKSNGYGIGAHQTSNNVISQNLIRDNYAGLYLQFCSNTTVHTNTLTRNLGAILAEDTINSAIRANKVFENNQTICLRTSRNINITNNMLSSNIFGIHIWNSSNIDITENNLYSHGGWSIGLISSTDSNVANNNISTVTGLDGIRLMFSSRNNLSGNNISYCEHSGILLWYDCYNNSATHNTISFSGSQGWGHGHGVEVLLSHANIFAGNSIMYGNNQGIVAIETSNNNFTENFIFSNRKGIILRASSGNWVYRNNIVNNSEQQGFDETGENFWDNGFDGNYWSDYAGVDSDGDGIGDTPYIVAENNVDNYPLMSPYLYADVNHDAIVNMRDIGLCCNAFNSYPGHPKWNPHCDINEDNIVNMRDIGITCNNFMKKWE